MKRIIAILLIIFGSATISAQHLSLDTCKAMALRNNAAVKNAVLDEKAAQEVKMQARTKYFPQISATGIGYVPAKPLIEYGIDDIGSAAARQQLHNLYYEYGAAMGLSDKISLCDGGLGVGVTAVQPVFMGGQIVGGNALADVGVAASHYQSQLTRDQVLQQVEETYWQTVSLLEKRITLQQAITFLDTLHRDVTVAAEAGLVTRNDVLKVELKQNEMQSNLLKVNNGITLSAMLLCQIIGMEYSENLALTDLIGQDLSSEAPTDADIRNAVYRRTEKQLLDCQVRAEKLKKEIAIGESVPHLMIGANASYGSLIFDRYDYNALAFMTLQVPLTGWWETAHKVRQQNYLIQKAENERADYVEKMALETRQAWCNIEEANSQVTLAESSVRSAEANLHDTKANFDAGMVAVSELLEAQTLLLQAQNQHTDALIDLKIKTERYKRLTR